MYARVTFTQLKMFCGKILGWGSGDEGGQLEGQLEGGVGELQWAGGVHVGGGLYEG